MTSQHPSHAESSQFTDKQPPAGGARLHVQRSPSKDNITVHFSLGKAEEEEEEELYTTSVSTSSAALKDSTVVTAVEASEDMFVGGPLDSVAESSRLSPSSKNHTNRSPTHVPEQKSFTVNSSPIKSLSFTSSDKSFISMVKSFSSDVESREGTPPAPAPTVKHRPLMKNLVKSLSSDTSQDPSSSSMSSRLPESRLNLQLLKQLAQSKMPSVAMTSVSDSKTAPCSPLTSPDNRSFFKVSEVEARFEDTKRRLTEAISEPLHFLGKIMDEKSGGLVGSSIYRPKGLSASATELCTLSSVSDPLESNNNNNCIKKEEGDLEAESPNSWTSVTAESPNDPSVNTKSPAKTSSLSMSALAKQEDEDFCILNSEDFDTCTDTEGSNGLTRTGSRALPSDSSDPNCDDKCEDTEPAPDIPYYTLVVLTFLVYGCFVLPLPSYVGGVLLGVGLGFLIAMGVVWLTGPKCSGDEVRHSRNQGKLLKLDIKEPEIYKGWMNEILNYDPETYHATLTQSVFVRLEGSTIRLSKPNRNIARRATHKEQKPDVSYVSQKIYDLTNSKVYLVPSNLARKRVWNKKYPICIELAKQDDFMSKTEGAGGNQTTSSRENEAQGRQSPSSCRRRQTLYLFGRTGRDKEDWFQRFLSASNVRVELKKTSSGGNDKKATSSHSRSSSRSSLNEVLASQLKSKDPAASCSTAGSAKSKPSLDYSVYMGSILPKQLALSPTAASSSSSLQSSPGAEKKLQGNTSAQVHPQGEEEEEDSVAWVNAALRRLFWDFLTEPYWAEVVSKKIQMKLTKIRLPYFMNELTLTELDMGSDIPRILGASAPYVDHQGLWFDLEVSYSGCFLMTLETKMILNRLGKEGDGLRWGEFGKDGYRPRTYCLAASDEESSSAGSSDEEDATDVSNDFAGAEGAYIFVGGHKPSKIMRFVDKITKSKYFQKATETEFIKKKMEEVSNTPLLLTVELQQLRGRLAVNIPPPPTDRIWYGFRTPPHLELKARPKLGEREVTLAHVTDWIGKKLEQEFQKILVMPNMDDVWLTLMHSAMDPRSAGGPLVSPPGNAEPS